MRTLLVNAFHYLRGGVERTYLDESRWLAAAGHDVLHFATQSPRNLPSPTSAHFAPAADYGETTPLFRQVGQLDRVFWSRPAAKALAGLLESHRPDVAHVHAPSRYLTPSVFRTLERAGVPVVMTLHDFKPWCTNRILFAHGEPCQRCQGGRHWRAFTTGCVQGSRIKSAVGMVEAYLHDAIGAYRSVRIWIAPSRFVAEKAIELGLEGSRIRVLPHGVEPATGSVHADTEAPERYTLFVGRLSIEKGVNLLPEIATAIAPTPLMVIGEGPMRAWLERAASKDSGSLRLLGRLEDHMVAAWRERAAAVVVPSRFPEHFCYAAAEAMLDRRPVVAARIGAIPELVEHEVTGLLASPADGHEIGAALRRALDDPAASTWGIAGRQRILSCADPDRHVDGLLAIYREAMDSPG